MSDRPGLEVVAEPKVAIFNSMDAKELLMDSFARVAV